MSNPRSDVVISTWRDHALSLLRLAADARRRKDKVMARLFLAHAQTVARHVAQLGGAA